MSIPFLSYSRRCVKHEKTLGRRTICPSDWQQRWRKIRDQAGFKGRWVQDVLRHTFASYQAKHHKDMALLQWNMGHRDQSLLRARYVNLQGITQRDARRFFT